MCRRHGPRGCCRLLSVSDISVALGSVVITGELFVVPILILTAAILSLQIVVQATLAAAFVPRRPLLNWRWSLLLLCLPAFLLLLSVAWIHRLASEWIGSWNCAHFDDDLELMLLDVEC